MGEVYVEHSSGRLWADGTVDSDLNWQWITRETHSQNKQENGLSQTR